LKEYKVGRPSRNDKGFAAFDVVLVLVIIFLVGAVAYLVGNRSTTKTASSSSSSTSKTATTESSYFDFKELGVKFIPDKSLNGLSYSLITGLEGSGTAVYITDTNVKAAYNECQADGGSNAIPGSETNESEAFASIGRSPGTFSDQVEEAVLVKQFNGFYITLSHPNGNNCAGTQADQDNWQQVTSTAETALTSSLKATITQD
jgi:uncharacterized protein (UPF0333 family)